MPSSVAARAADAVQRLVRDVPDHPEPGVLFKDITPLLADADGFADTVAALAEAALEAAGGSVDKVVGMEARGFILAAPVALALGAGFVPVRKVGKLPHEAHQVTYDLEYGSATLELHRDALAPGDRVLVVDDVLATGGTAGATLELIGRCGAEPVAMAVLIELGFLSGREQIGDLPCTALLTVD